MRSPAPRSRCRWCNGQKVANLYQFGQRIHEDRLPPALPLPAAVASFTGVSLAMASAPVARPDCGFIFWLCWEAWS